MPSLCLHLHVLSFGWLVLVVVLVVGRQRAGGPPAALRHLLAGGSVADAEGPAQRRGPARATTVHLHRGGVSVVLTWLRAGAFTARLTRHLFILLSLITVLKEEVIERSESERRGAGVVFGLQSGCGKTSDAAH